MPFPGVSYPRGMENGYTMTLLYSFVLGAYWANFAGMLGFSSVYLLECGLNSTEIGIVVAVAGLIAAVMQPIVAGYADKEKAPSLKVIIIFISALALFMAMPLFFYYRRSTFLSGLLYGISILFLQLLMPFVNSLGTETIGRGARLNWGMARGTGSVSYAIASFIVGRSVAGLGVTCIPASIVACFGLLILAVILFPFKKVEGNAKGKEKGGRQDEGQGFFKEYKDFAFILAGTTLLFASHNYINVFVYQIIASKGGGNSDVGSILGLCAIFELPTMILWSYMLKKLKCQTWLKICSVFMALKSIGSLIVPTMALFYPLQLLQTLGFGLLAIAPVYYAMLTIDKKNAIKGQAYITLTSTAGSVIASITGGRIIDMIGVNAMLVAASLTGALGSVLYFVFIRGI